MYACPLTVAFNPSGSVCSLLLAWHMEQFASMFPLPDGSNAGYQVVVKSFEFP